MPTVPFIISAEWLFQKIKPKVMISWSFSGSIHCFIFQLYHSATSYISIALLFPENSRTSIFWTVPLSRYLYCLCCVCPVNIYLSCVCNASDFIFLQMDSIRPLMILAQLLSFVRFSMIIIKHILSVIYDLF